MTKALPPRYRRKANGSLRGLQRLDILIGEGERNHAEDSEGAIDGAPEEGDVADWPGDQGEWQHEGARQHPELHDPDVPHRVLQGAEKRECDHEMPERQPVRAVREERVA